MGLRHAAGRRVELPVHPVPARVRPGAGGADRHRPDHDRDALPVRGEPRRRRRRDAARAAAAARRGKSDRSWRETDREERRPLVGGHGARAPRSRPTRSTRSASFHELSPRLPDDAIVTADSGSAANWYARHLRMRGRHARLAVRHAGDDGPRRAVRDRRQVRAIPDRPGDRPRRRRRDADERHGRADHDRASTGRTGPTRGWWSRCCTTTTSTRSPGSCGRWAAHRSSCPRRTLPDVPVRRLRPQRSACTASRSRSPDEVGRAPGTRRWRPTGPCVVEFVHRPGGAADPAARHLGADARTRWSRSCAATRTGSTSSRRASRRRCRSSSPDGR